MTDTILQWNLSIDFNSKNKKRTTSRTSSRWNYSWWSRRQTKWKEVADLNSDIFLKHLKQWPYEDLGTNLSKLIKKWEKPLRIWSLLWMEQVWQCLFMEYENDIILVDAGMEFAPKEAFWADYIIPDISYIKKNIKKLRWIVITHGHLDHVWALRDILPELWFPMIYTTPLSLWIIKKSFDDPKLAEKVKYKIVDPDIDIIKLGCFSVEFIPVNHNIPETLALSIHTPKGIVFNSADFKIDHTPAIDRPADLSKIARIWVEWVKLYIWDSLWSDKKWWSPSEYDIGKNLDDMIKWTKWRLLIATFASNIGRVIQIINSCVKYDKRVFLSGRSMVNNVDICDQLWYINVPKWYIQKLSEDVNTLPDEKVVVLSTWAQWEEMAALTRMSRWEHNIIELRQWDTILRSASTIPGNETAVWKMIDDLVLKNVNIITNDDIDIHASWHGGEEDHKLMLSLLRPQFFLPYFLNAAARYAHKWVAMKMWMPEERIIMPAKNGHVIEMYDDVVLLWKDQMKLDTVLVDGKWKGHMSGEYVIKAREIMSQDGMLSLIFKVDTKTKQLVWNIQIESRGFVYSSEVKDIHTKVVDFAREKYLQNQKKRMMVKDNLKNIKIELWDYLNKVIWRAPMIIPMFVYINKDTKDEMTKTDAIVWMTLDEQGSDL